jgi:CheY-like chemotaxis protein
VAGRGDGGTHLSSLDGSSGRAFETERMFRHIAFLDDSPEELEAFERLFSGRFRITTVLVEQPAGALAKVRARLKGKKPDLFLLDLYYPQVDDAPRELRSGAVLEACRQIAAVADAAAKLPQDFSNPTLLLKEAHGLVAESRQLLWLLCRELRQSPEAGVRVLQELQLGYPRVPKVFYSRKATIDDLKSAMGAGASDLLLKPHPREENREAPRLAEKFASYCDGKPLDWRRNE